MAQEDIFHLGVKAIIRNSQGEILVLEKNPKNRSGLNPYHWDLPGGRLKTNQNIESALHREVEEEIGIKDLKVINFFDASLSSFRVQSGETTVGLILFTFVCKIPNTNLVKLTDDEHSKLDWVDSKKAAELLKVKFGEDFAQKVAKL